ncbi:MAG: hypothetical protein J5817_07830 [Treponema sp.]|nr:hypothetical protein [Treponema sp.]
MIKVYLKLFLSFILIHLLIVLSYAFFAEFTAFTDLLSFIKVIVILLFPFIALFICRHEKIENRNRWFIVDSLYAVFFALASLFINHLTLVYILKSKLPGDFKSGMLSIFLYFAFFIPILLVALAFQILLLHMSKKWKEPDPSAKKN